MLWPERWYLMLRGVGQPGPISCVPAAVEHSQHCSKNFGTELRIHSNRANLCNCCSVVTNARSRNWLKWHKASFTCWGCRWCCERRRGSKSVWFYSLWVTFPACFRATCTLEISLPQVLQESSPCLFIAASEYAPI